MNVLADMPSNVKKNNKTTVRRTERQIDRKPTAEKSDFIKGSLKRLAKTVRP